MWCPCRPNSGSPVNKNIIKNIYNVNFVVCGFLAGSGLVGLVGGGGGGEDSGYGGCSHNIQEDGSAHWGSMF